MLTIGLSAGAMHPEIDWPQRIEQDHQIMQMVQQIRSAGIGVVTHINKSSQGTDTLEFHTEYTVALYRRGLYVPPLSADEFFKMDQITVTPTEPPVPCWILTQVENVGVLESQPGEDYSALGMELSRYIPDIHKQVKSPCKCQHSNSIYLTIQHLNDYHHPKRKVNGRRIRETWTREQIADWLDEVDADLTFDPDLPAKRAARRKATRAQQVELMQKGLIPTNALLQQISGELKAVEPKIDELNKSFVKLDVAIEEFAATIHESLNKANQPCACHMCAKKEES